MFQPCFVSLKLVITIKKKHKFLKGILYCLLISFLFVKSANAVFERALDLDQDFVSKTIRAIAKHAYKDTVHGAHGYEDAPKPHFAVEEINSELYYKYPFYSKIPLPIVGHKLDLSGAVYRYKNKVIVSFHGSEWHEDWIHDAQFLLTPEGYGLGGKVHKGFKALADAAFDPMLAALTKLLDPKNKDIMDAYIQLNPQYTAQYVGWNWTDQSFEFIFTGHSLGGALANIEGGRFASLPVTQYAALGCQLSPNSIKSDNQLKIITFSSPRIGDVNLINSIHTKIPRHNILRFLCKTDIAPKVPLKCMGYEDIGWPLEILGIEHTTDKMKIGVNYLRHPSGFHHPWEVASRFGGLLVGGVAILVSPTSSLLVFSVEQLMSKSYLQALWGAQGTVGKVFGLFHEVPTRESVARALHQAKIEESLSEEMDFKKGPGEASFWSVYRNPVLNFLYKKL